MRRPTAVLILLTSSIATAEPEVAVRSDSTVTATDWSLQLALGRAETQFVDGGVSFGTSSELAAIGSLRYGLSDRLTWSIPTLAFAYRFGDRGGTEVVPFGGITSWGLGYSSVEGWIGQINLGAGTAVRQWLAHDLAINVDASIGSRARWAQDDVNEVDGGLGDGSFGPSTWGAAASVGLSYHAGDRLVLNLGGRGSIVPVVSGEIADDVEPIVELGSVQSIGLRSLPLAAIRVGRRATIDLHGSLAVNLDTGTRTARYLAGTTLVW